MVIIDVYREALDSLGQPGLDQVTTRLEPRWQHPTTTWP